MKLASHRSVRISGFTLVELLVSIVIIAVLAALVFSLTRGIMRQAAASRDASTMSQMWNCIMLYTADRNDLMPGPLFNGQVPVFRQPVRPNPKEWRRLSDCLAPYLGYDNPKEGDFIEPMFASWQKTPESRRLPAYYMQHELPIGEGNEIDSPWGKPAPATSADRMPMTYSAVMSQPQTRKTWAMTEIDSRHEYVSKPNPLYPQGLAHGNYRLGIYFDGSVRKLNKDNDPL